MFQKVIIVGNLGNDPEQRFTPKGDPVTSFSVAVNDRDETTWFRVSVWGAQAEPCKQYLAKGRPVLVEGRLNPDDNGNPRTFQRKDGTTGSSYELTASNVRFLGKAEADQNVPF